MSKIALGTVQFGLDYGISNNQGQVSLTEVQKILNNAFELGITVIDTASAYGLSEVVLGKAIPKNNNFKVISKYPLDIKQRKIKDVLNESLTKLKKKTLFGYMLHNYKCYEQNKNAFNELNSLKKEGLVEKIGISLYHPNELQSLWSDGISFDIIQVPFNILDQRFLPLFNKLKKDNVEIHTRSSFLQGLFFKDEDKLPDFFLPVKKRIKDIKHFAKVNNLSIAELCLGFCLLQTPIDHIVIGVDNVQNLLQNMKSEEKITLLLNHLEELSNFAFEDNSILNPSMWKL